MSTGSGGNNDPVVAMKTVPQTCEREYQRFCNPHISQFQTFLQQDPFLQMVLAPSPLFQKSSVQALDDLFSDQTAPASPFYEQDDSSLYVMFEGMMASAMRLPCSYYRPQASVEDVFDAMIGSLLSHSFIASSSDSSDSESAADYYYNPSQLSNKLAEYGEKVLAETKEEEGHEDEEEKEEEETKEENGEGIRRRLARRMTDVSTEEEEKEEDAAYVQPPPPVPQMWTIVEEVIFYEPAVIVVEQPSMTETFHSRASASAAPKEDEYNTCLWKAYKNEQVSPFCALDLRDILIDVERMEQKIRLTNTLGFGIAFLGFLFSMYICFFNDDDEEDDDEYLDNNVFEDGYEYQELSCEKEKKSVVAYVAVPLRVV